MPEIKDESGSKKSVMSKTSQIFKSLSTGFNTLQNEYESVKSNRAKDDSVPKSIGDEIDGLKFRGINCEIAVKSPTKKAKQPTTLSRNTSNS